MPGNCSKKSQDCDWTFNFRTSSYFFDDSESDSETTQLNDKDTVASTAPAKDRLLDGIDLSTREETVVYKPNPFSIAKINAANRAQNQEHRALTQGRQKTSGGSPLRRPLKLVPKPSQTTVLDGFKIQAQKARLRIRPAASPVKQSQAVEASNARVLVQKSSEHRVPNVASISPLNSESASSNIPTHRHTEGHSTLSVNIPLENAHISTRNNFNASYKKTFKEDFKKALSAIPVSQNSISLNTSAQFASRFTQNFSPRLSRTTLPMSSPLRGKVSATNFNDARLSSPVVAGPRSDIPSPNSIPYRRTLFKPSMPFAKIESRISPVPPASNIPAGIEMAENLLPLDVHPRLKTKRAPSTPPREFLKKSPPETLFRRQTSRSRAPIASSFSNKRSITDAYAFSPGDPDEEWSTLPSRKRKKPNPETFRLPSLTKPFIVPGLLSTDVLGKPEVKNIQNGRKVHLYIPPPLPLGNSNSSGRESEERDSHSLKTNGSRNASSSISLNMAPETQSSTAADVYPSPSRSRVSRPSCLVTRGRKDITPKGQIGRIYRPPSPPTSDLPIPGEDIDMHFRIDLQDVRKRHPATKALFEKRIRDSYAYLREILELESCGVVFRDANVDDLLTAEQNSEIGIPHWPSHLARHMS